MRLANKARMAAGFFFATFLIAGTIGCGDGSGGGASEYDGGVTVANGGTGGTTGAGGTTSVESQKTCPLYLGYFCDPSNYDFIGNGYGCNEPGYKCLAVEIKDTSPVGDGLWIRTNYCIKAECQSCDKSCVYSANGTIDEQKQCQFSFCNSTSQGKGGNTGSSSAGGTSGHTTIAPPPVNCSSYSFRGCSQVGSATFSSNCIRVGCHFSLDSCTTAGDFDSPTCDCNCS